MLFSCRSGIPVPNGKRIVRQTVKSNLYTRDVAHTRNLPAEIHAKRDYVVEDVDISGVSGEFRTDSGRNRYG